ncbi:MAG: chromosome segregation protein SMC [Halobacteriovoraceae bacterium]|nr:chromosome segregation protein SMC [Halobacteriovoraceae bacterium]
MRLKRLVVQGFKSFKDRTTIHFDDGITGIVGPNGCGKSNIVDALFWVMGEQSAKHLRGNSMKDLIFAGSSKYKPATWAEATLVLGNDEGKHIHIGSKVSNPSEIQLTRKLYRNGETEYRINGTPCRLKDIQEVFMDTGAGAKSYSIIAQGEINRLVQAKPQERRTMIEEVAGITKFKIRKRDSLKKIEQAEQNLNRLRDLQTEIEKNLRSLQKQAEKAEKAKSLKEKIKRNDLIVYSHNEFDLLKDIKSGKEILTERQNEIENWTAQKTTLETDLEEERIRKDELTEKIEGLQKEYNDLSKELAQSESRLNYLNQSCKEKEKQIEIRQKELDEVKLEVDDRREKRESLECERDDLEKQSRRELDFDTLEEELDEVKFELENKESQFQECEEKLLALKEELTKKEQDFYKNQNKKEELSANLEDINKELEALEKQYSGVSTDMANERSQLLESEKNLLAIEELVSEMKSSVENLTSDYSKMDLKVKEQNKEIIGIESKLESLMAINDSLEEASEGTSEFLKLAGLKEHNVLGALIKCDELYSKNIQSIFGRLLNNIVTKKGEFSAVFSWAIENTEKAIEVLDIFNGAEVSQEGKERLKLALDCEELIEIKDIVEIDDEFKSILLPLFEGHFIVDKDIDVLQNLNSDLNFRSISTLNGKGLIFKGNDQQVISLNAKDSGQGVIARNNKIKLLGIELENKKESFAENEKILQSIETNLSTDRIKLEELREQGIQKRSDFMSKKAAFEAKTANLDTGNARIEILKNRKTQISEQRFNLLEYEDIEKKDLESLIKRLDGDKEYFEDLKDELGNIRITYNEKKQYFLEKQVEFKSFDDRIKSFQSQIEDVEKQIERGEQREKTNMELIERLAQEIEDLSIEAESLEENNQKKVEDLQDQQEVLSLQKDQLADLLSGMMDRENLVKELTKSLSKAEKQIVEYEIQLGQFLTNEEQNARNIFEKYHINIRRVIGMHLEYIEKDYLNLNDIENVFYSENEEGQRFEIPTEAYEFHRRYGQDLKECKEKLKKYKNEYSQIGEINWQAVEDYERQKLRFNFLRDQEIELKKSLEDLQIAISHIDEKSKKRFKLAFEEVNERFTKVFPIIFGGGNASLKLVGDINDPECGVDVVAQPPGKKMQNINLMSGGEKAMTAVSLIFSIFLVKPSPFCLLDEVDAPLDDANVGRFNELLREMSSDSQFILITHNKKTMELNDVLYGVTMQEAGVSKAVSVQLH